MDKRFDELLVEHKDLYLFECEAGRVMFRLLPYNKYTHAKYIVQNYPTFRWSLEDDIWEECVIEHTFDCSVDYIYAGVITVVTQLILKLSCSSRTDEANYTLDIARNQLQDAAQQAIIFVCEAFPSYLPEDVEKMRWNDILKRLAQAEIILNKSFEFKSETSQEIDDSAKIFKELDEHYENNIDAVISQPVDFEADNSDFYMEEFSDPKGDFNINNRG